MSINGAIESFEIHRSQSCALFDSISAGDGYPRPDGIVHSLLCDFCEKDIHDGCSEDGRLSGERLGLQF